MVLTTPDGEPDELLTIEQAMELLSMSRTGLSNWRRQRQGPRWYRLSHREIRYRRSDLLAWLDQCEVKPAS